MPYLCLHKRLDKLENHHASGKIYIMVQTLDNGLYKVFYVGRGQQPAPDTMTADEYLAFSGKPNVFVCGIIGMDFEAL